GAVAVTHHHEGGEGEPAAALDDLRHAVDAHDALEERRLLGVLPAAAALTATALAALAATAGIAVVGVVVPPAGGRGAVVPLCSHIQILFSSCVRAAITAPGRPRERRRRRRPRGRGTCSRRGRTRRSRSRRPSHARRPGTRRCEPCPTCCCPSRAGPPPWSRPTRGSCPGRRRRPARRRGAPSG